VLLWRRKTAVDSGDSLRMHQRQDAHSLRDVQGFRRGEYLSNDGTRGPELERGDVYPLSLAVEGGYIGTILGVCREPAKRGVEGELAVKRDGTLLELAGGRWCEAGFLATVTGRLPQDLALFDIHSLEFEAAFVGKEGDAGRIDVGPTTDCDQGKRGFCVRTAIRIRGHLDFDGPVGDTRGFGRAHRLPISRGCPPIGRSVAKHPIVAKRYGVATLRNLEGFGQREITGKTDEEGDGNKQACLHGAEE
jgi:hypothetical protein